MHRVKPQDDPASRLLGLELLRFACAAGVLVFHFQHFMFVGSDGTRVMLSALPLDGWTPVHLAYRFGHLGVLYFWCISGYIFFWKYRATIASGAVGGRRFLLLRFSRLYPLHLATLLLVAMLQAWHWQTTSDFFVYSHNSVADFLPHLAMASNWSNRQPFSFNGPIWSVSAEILVYVMFFLATRYSSGNRKAALALFLFSTIATLWTGNHVMACLSLFYGGGVAAIGREKAAGWQRFRTLEWLALLVVTLALVAIWKLRLDHAPWFDWNHFLQLIAPLTVFVLAADFRLLHRWSVAIQALGNMTYSSYLIHFPLQLATALAFAMMGAALPYASAWLLAVYLVVVLMLAFVVHRYFEVPAQRAIRRRSLGK